MMFENERNEFERYSYRINPDEPAGEDAGADSPDDQKTAQAKDNAAKAGAEEQAGNDPASQSRIHTATGSVYEEAREKMHRHNRRSRRSDRGNAHSSHRAARPHRSRNPYITALCCALIFGVVSGGILLGAGAVNRHMAAKQIPVETTAEKLGISESKFNETNGKNTEAGYTVSSIAEKCKSSVVAITNKSISEIQTMFGVLQQESEGSGSGVIIGKNDTELLIATNNHVVENSKTLSVCFNDSEDAVFDAQIKGTDPENDLAIVAIKLSDIDADVLKSVSIATIGDSKNLKVGDGVVAIGNALGFGQSVTSGVVSATDREVTIENMTATLIQTDAAINPGNSGGALFNMRGELIGINTAKYASEQIEGMGFAIPMNTAKPIFENLMSRKTREKVGDNHGTLGITGKDVDEDASKMYGIPQGAYVETVNEDGGAAAAGIKKGDIITKFDGKTVTGIKQLASEMEYYKVGETVEVVISRNSGKGYKEQTVKVKLGKASNNAQIQQDTQDQENQQEQQETPWGYGDDGEEQSPNEDQGGFRIPFFGW